jgi:hypothetical protein
MAFGMPATKLSRQALALKRRKFGSLDILASGMPKISRYLLM